MLINTNKPLTGTDMSQIKTVKKEESTEPKDGFKKCDENCGEHTGYGENLLKSTVYGGLKGFGVVGNAVEKVLPSVDGLDHTGLHILFGSIAVGAGAIIGIPFGAVTGFAIGLFGGSVELPKD